MLFNSHFKNAQKITFANTTRMCVPKSNRLNSEGVRIVTLRFLFTYEDYYGFPWIYVFLTRIACIKMWLIVILRATPKGMQSVKIINWKLYFTTFTQRSFLKFTMLHAKLLNMLINSIYWRNILLTYKYWWSVKQFWNIERIKIGENNPATTSKPSQYPSIYSFYIF